MRLSSALTSLVAVVVAGALLLGAWLALRPAGPALVEAAFTPAALSPNADGQDDVVRLRYVLRRAASISIYFLDAQGRRFDLRTDARRAAGEYEVLFSGIVDPYHLPGDDFQAELLARVLPNGDYRWVVEARDAQGRASSLTGALTVTDADAALPNLKNLTASPPVFTPNQDGLSDRVTINVWLDKDVGEDGLHVFLIGPDGARLPIPETPSDIKPGQRGLHAYDYDGGVDLGQEPPPDGTYTVRAEVEDWVGQKMAAATTLTIRLSGLPRAEILLGQVEWSSSSVIQGQTLYFTLTVENYGTAPLRTSGPPSGYVYASMSENANTLGQYEQPGVWRAAVMCQTCESDYPWRWALGTPEQLTLIPDEKGRPQYYLLPGQSVTVTGGIVLDRIVESLNPQYFWAGLIHEFVGIAPINNRVDQEFVMIVPAQ
jgi:hypothetical protein